MASPTDILLSASTVIENSSNGSVIGGLTAVDPDVGNTFTYALLDDAGGRFSIAATSATTANPLSPTRRC